MLRTCSLFAVAACLLFPARLIAGGMPWLCLPIDGVTPGKVEACAELLTARLQNKQWSHDRGIKIQQHAKQWYLTFSMGESVALSDVEAALEDSGFSVPRDKLRLFGHLILEVDARPSSSQDFLTGLKSLKNVSVAESAEKKGGLEVTVDMPYPAGGRGRDRAFAGWETFQRNDFSTDTDRSRVTAAELPSLDDFRDIVAKHNVSLKDIRWSENYACRPLGAVVAADQEAAGARELATAVGRWSVEFTNGVTEMCDIFNFDGGQATVDEPQRRSRGNVAVQGSSVVIHFHDDRVERWTSVGKRFVVEHWFPGSQFPDATPVLGIAERSR